jgi:hypothetical protein
MCVYGGLYVQALTEADAREIYETRKDFESKVCCTFNSLNDEKNVFDVGRLISFPNAVTI